MKNINLPLAVVFLVACCSVPTQQQSCTITSPTQVSTVTAACTTITVGSFSVPANTTMIINLRQGSSLTFTGQINFGSAAFTGFLLEITGNNVNVQGSGSHLLHGNGQLIWDGLGLNGGRKPTFLYLKGNGSTFSNLHLKNCPARCVAIDGSHNTIVRNFTIDNSEGANGTAPSGKEGHNTDGFDIAKSTFITLRDSTVNNQDDCVAINEGSNIFVDNLQCTGSHGFDIAAGMSQTFSHNVVEHVTFQNSVLNQGMYGLHILTCNDGGMGKVNNITYRNIRIVGPSDWGIIIQQDFSNARQGSTGNPTGNVPVSNVTYNGITGSMNGRFSSSMVFRCATGSCTNIRGTGVSLTGASSANQCRNITLSGFTC